MFQVMITWVLYILNLSQNDSRALLLSLFTMHVYSPCFSNKKGDFMSHKSQSKITMFFAKVGKKAFGSPLLIYGI